MSRPQILRSFAMKRWHGLSGGKHGTSEVGNFGDFESLKL